jgi:c-di-GMP-binding flagellar brake protein YcgR
MILEDQFKIGDKVKIGIRKDGNEQSFYDSKIADISEEENIVKIYNISDSNNSVNLFPGDSISVMRDSGSVIFLFDTNYIGKDRSRFDYLLLKFPKKIERLQRREFFRLPINVKLSLKKEDDDTGEIFLGETLDLSGSGLSVDLDAVLEKDDKVVISLPLTNDIQIDDIYGKVSRVGDGELLPYRYGIEFTDIEANKKEKIVAYIFEVQRMRIKLAKSMALS